MLFFLWLRPSGGNGLVRRQRSAVLTAAGGGCKLIVGAKPVVTEGRCDASTGGAAAAEGTEAEQTGTGAGAGALGVCDFVGTTPMGFGLLTQGRLDGSCNIGAEAEREEDGFGARLR